MTPSAAPDRWLLLYSDRSDPVSRIVLDHLPDLGCEVVALSLVELLNDVAPGPCWVWPGGTIVPARTAVINRIAFAQADGPLASVLGERQFWSWLYAELRRFAYVSAMPTATSPMGGYGSLLDQWLDLPDRFAGVRVPAFRRPWEDEALQGDVYAADPWNLYSLGTRLPADGTAPSRSRLAYVRPRGYLVHVAQVGAAIAVANAPPGMSPVQQSSIAAFARAIALHSATRILEHAFFVGDDLPVLYSTCPSPVITGSLPHYPSLLVQGLRHDLDHHRTSAAP